MHGDGHDLHEPVNLKVLLVGKTREGWLKQGIDEYLKRLAPLQKVDLVEIPDVSLSVAANQAEVKSREAALCLKRIDPEDYLVVLDETGQAKTSLEFAAFLTKLSERKSVLFLIGGVYGVDPQLRDRANETICLSRLTFTHQMARLILLEQLYRAMMIKHNRSYHY